VSAGRTTNHKGNAAELAIAAEAARLGLSVFAPLTEHERYDLILGVADRLLRVQCKWGPFDGESVYIRLTTSYRSSGRGYVVKGYKPTEIDAVAVYCEALQECYLIPIEVIAGLTCFTLRVAPARNNQRAALNFAAAYGFPGAVAQLAERFAGSEEVRGSIPLSSTAGSLGADSSIEVGAHEFRNRFGYYMERAAAGAEILIRRRGRPFVRMRGCGDSTACDQVPMTDG
jgi:hypothetical protein